MFGPQQPEKDRLDLELEAIANVADAVKDLTWPERQRVLGWAHERFVVNRPIPYPCDQEQERRR